MKRADAVRFAQVELKMQVADSDEKYAAALRKAEEQLKRNRMRWIYFKLQYIQNTAALCVAKYLWLDRFV